MYHGKHIRKSKRPVALLASLVMLLAVAVVGTAAFLTTSKGPVTNTFTPAHVPNKVEEKFDGNTKSEVKIQNTGDVPAYIRVALVATWVKLDNQGKPVPGEVYGEQPVWGEDYTWYPNNTDGAAAGYNTTDWALKDGYYYYKQSVAAGASTNTLFTKCGLMDGVTPPTGYVLSIEILSQSIQADGVASDGVTKPVTDAWDVAVKPDGALDVQ